MKWGSRAGSVKSRRRKPAAPKRASEAKVARPRSSSAADQRLEFAQLARERDEALEREKAAADVLSVINSSPGVLQPVFQSILENATRICEAKFGMLYLPEAGGLRLVAAGDVPPAFAEARKRGPIHHAPGGPFGEAVRRKQAVHLIDLAATREYAERHPATVAAVELGGVRTVLAVPMLRSNELSGVVGIYRQEVRPFTDKQIALVQNFAAQAVIAIENARLLKELRDRTEQVEAQSYELAKLNQQLEQRVSDQVGEIERMGRLRRFLPHR